jgi:hypothetical protein
MWRPVQIDITLSQGHTANVPVRIGELAVPGYWLPMGANDFLGLGSRDLVDVFPSGDPLPPAD